MATLYFLKKIPNGFRQSSKSSNVECAYCSVPDATARSRQPPETYRSEPFCSPSKAYLRGNYKCKLALTGLPDEVYDKEWDLIMIDAPKGYFPEAPGRMAAIFSAVVMARGRKGSGVTHVFLHDVDRRVEKMFAEEFLCRKYLVKAVGRLWHFEIPAANVSQSGGWFC
ncbi:POLYSACCHARIDE BIOSYNTHESIS PROTEIN [Salix koriyanagi]|uniref:POLYSACCHARIDE BIOSYNTHESIS PROTEIN n=1 Tax=Salix koriyanagi TaxID=2511006 RepID=A0A9Q0PV83_9ROSI|nr:POLYSACCHARIDE BIOSYNTHESIS PROTEIN [Salix koriyanagi]